MAIPYTVRSDIQLLPWLPWPPDFGDDELLITEKQHITTFQTFGVIELEPSAHHLRRHSLRPVDNCVYFQIFRNSSHEQREGDFESIFAEEFKLWAASAAAQHALVDEILAAIPENGLQMSTSLQMMLMPQNRGVILVPKLQTSATLSKTWELQQAMAIARSHNLDKALVKKYNFMLTSRSLTYDEESQSTFQPCVYGINPMYPALDYDHHADHSIASYATPESNENPLLPSTTISVTTKVENFDTAKMKCEVTSHSDMGPDQGTRRWRAPEMCANAYNDKRFTNISDVYSFAVVAYKILTGPDISVSELSKYESLTHSLRPKLSENCPETLASLTLECSHTDSRRRPIFAETCTTLRYFKGDLQTMRGFEKPLGLYWGKRSWFNSWPCLAKVSATVNGAGNHNSGGIMTSQNSTKVMGMVHLVDGVNEHRKQTDKVNVDTKLKGEPATALKVMDKKSSLCSDFKAHSTAAVSQNPSDWARTALAMKSRFIKSTCEIIKSMREILKVSLELHQAVLDDGKTVTAVGALRMAGIEKPFELRDFKPATKRIRTRDWSAEEVHTMLDLMEEASKVDVGPDIWDFVSDNLYDKYGFDRASNSCENLWGTLLQSYEATRDHDDIRASTEFESEYREKIGRLHTLLPFEDNRNIQKDSGLPSSALPLCQFQSIASYMGYSDSADCDKVLNYESTDEEMEEVDTYSADEGLSDDSTATIESQAVVAADSHASRIIEPYYETNSNYASNKRSATRVMEDDLISRIAPFVNKQIEEALKPLLCLLRGAEDEQKHLKKP